MSRVLQVAKHIGLLKTIIKIEYKQKIIKSSSVQAKHMISPYVYLLKSSSGRHKPVSLFFLLYRMYYVIVQVTCHRYHVTNRMWCHLANNKANFNFCVWHSLIAIWGNHMRPFAQMTSRSRHLRCRSGFHDDSNSSLEANGLKSSKLLKEQVA